MLELFARQPRWGVRELAAAMGTSKSGVHRTLQELAEVGLLRRNDETEYEQAAGFVRLAAVLSEGALPARVAQPRLDQGRDECGETVILTMYNAATTKFAAVAAAESHQPVRYIWQALRDWSDVHLGASGKAILAFLDETERERIVAALPDPIPGPRSFSKAAFRRDLAETRRRGWAVSDGERYPGAQGVGAPVFGRDGHVFGGVVIGWPSRLGDDERVEALGALCRRLAAEISADFGAR
jgi:DNA-binding IclR family transcriptional regulator